MRKKIEGYPNYYISDRGEIFSGNRKLTTGIHNGYRTKRLKKSGKGKTFLIHRLVALAFLEKPKTGKMEVNHINGDKSDNRVENLEWVTHSENMSHAVKMGKMKTCPVFVFDKAGKLLWRFSSVAEASRKLKVSSGAISGSLTRTGTRRLSVGGYRFSRTKELIPFPELRSRKKLTKLKGAFWDKRRKTWGAYIYHNGKQINLGRFDTDGEAHIAYLKGYKRLKAESI